MVMAAPQLWNDAYDIGDVPDADLLALWDSGKTSELWEGRLVQEDMTAPYHGVVANEIGHQLRSYLGQQGINAFVMQHSLFNLTQPGQMRTILAPDVALFPVGVVVPRQGIPRFAPWLAVEILSPTQTITQMRIKGQTYLQAGSAEVWMVEPDQEQIEVVTPGATAVYSRQQQLVSSILPGFRPLVQSLFP